MSNELLINVAPTECRVALVENGLLQELHLERSGDLSFVGNIYLGRVERVLPGMQAAFVDVGLSRTAFLHATEIVSRKPPMDPDAAADGNADDGAPEMKEPEEPVLPPIDELLHEGQLLPVQVIKDPMGSKGARLSARLSLPSRYLVLLPGADSVGVSLRIENPEERARLKALTSEILASSPDCGAGLIVRTNAEGMGRKEIERDFRYLIKLWQQVSGRMKEVRSAGEWIYKDLSLPLRALRDLMNGSIERVRIDDRKTCEEAREFAASFMSEWSDRIELYEGDGPLFDIYGIEDEITRALKRTVELKSGGYLSIDQTEALTTIDVNTGRFVGTRNFAETVYKTNLEAAQAVARQLRLRNLGGIIIVDFIDMHDEEHRRQVLRVLQQALARDPARTTVSGISALGLVEMTRKRTTESLEHRLCEPCPHCEGRGWLKSVDTVCAEIFREVQRAQRQFDTGRLMVLASPRVIEKLLEDYTAALADVTERLGTSIRLQPEEHYAQEQFDVVLF